MRLLKSSSLLLLLIAGDAIGGVLSGHSAIRCSNAPEASSYCESIKTSAFEGRFATLIGLDGSFSSKYSERAVLSYQGPSSNSSSPSSNENTASFRLKDSLGFRFGPSIRIHVLDTLGVSFDTGFQWSSLGTDEDEEQSTSVQNSFSVSYSGAYVGGSLFLPVQKVDKFGLMASYRRYIVDQGNATMRLPYGSDSEFKAKPLTPIREMSIGFFGSIFYFSYAVREEGWKILGTSQEQFSNITSKANGVELGISGPVWYVWP